MAFKNDVYTFHFSSATTLASFSSSVNLRGAYAYMYLEIGTMAAGYSTASTPIWIQGSSDDTTFRRITNLETTANTLVAGINDFVIASSVSNRFVFVPYPGLDYVRLAISGTCTNPTAICNAAAFKLICVPNQ